jgi:hypothetical protein
LLFKGTIPESPPTVQSNFRQIVAETVKYSRFSQEQKEIICPLFDSACNPISYKQKFATLKSLALENESLCGIKTPIDISTHVNNGHQVANKKRDRQVHDYRKRL